MAECNPELWKLKNIKEALEGEITINGSKRKIVIPLFQRGKRWTKETKDMFIDSLTKGYPIGSLLFYKTQVDNVDVFTLIDGLQRGSSIKEYLSNPTKFFDISKISKEAREKLYGLIVVGGNAGVQKAKADELLTTYIRSLKTYDDYDLLNLYTLFLNEFPVLNGKTSEFGLAVRDELNRLKNDYNHLSEIQIPAVVYTGDESTLPEIFTRINKEGKPLSEYEIFAASWPSAEFKIENEQIVEYVLKKYDMLNDTEFTLSGYNRDEKRINKSVNAFEYAFGFSKYITNKYSSLAFYTDIPDDVANQVGFQLINACFNSSHNQIKDVHKIITRFFSNISKLEEAIEDSIRFVDKCIEPILKFKGNNREKKKGFHSQFQIMSLISFAFRKKYNIQDDTLKINEDWRASKQKLEENIWKYYVFDIINKYWGEGGTGKIHSANSENRYLTDLTSEQFGAAYDSYSAALLSRREIKNVSYPSDIDYVILNTIYLNLFTAMDQLSLKRFDVEHIATKDQMKKFIKVTNGEGLPISHIANLCYLPEFENRSKGSKNFYQDTNYLSKAGTTIETIEEKYSFTSKPDLEFMDLEYQDGDFDILRLYYVDEFLANRNKIVRKKFLESLGFENAEEVAAPVQEIQSETVFNEQYYRTTKIGRLVRETFSYLSRNGYFSDVDVKNLKNKDYSLKELGAAYPVLLEVDQDPHDSHGTMRYYKDFIEINGHKYYLTSEWFEHDRKLVAPWIKKKLGQI